MSAGKVKCQFFVFFFPNRSNLDLVLFLKVVGDAGPVFQVAVGAAHVDEANECHRHRDRDHRVEDNGCDVQVRL